MDKGSQTADRFAYALARHAPGFGVALGPEAIARLREYYEQLTAWNARLHLVAPCSPEEFAARHVLESLTALPHLAENSSVADVGSGAGLPIIPCLIARPDIRATLIESSGKKAVFLRETLRRVGAGGRATVSARRFEDTDPGEAAYVTCRALDRFTEVFPKLLKWSAPARTLLLFGGETLRDRIEKAGLVYGAELTPESERRFLFIVSLPGQGAKPDASEK